MVDASKLDVRSAHRQNQQYDSSACSGLWPHLETPARFRVYYPRQGQSLIPRQVTRPDEDTLFENVCHEASRELLGEKEHREMS